MAKSKQDQEREQLKKSVENFLDEKVRPEEALARVNKASYEKMYYYLEGLKIIEEYEGAIAKATSARDEFQKQLAEKQAEFEAQNTGLQEDLPENVHSIEEVLPTDYAETEETL
jgi:hypothetical protein